MLFDSFDVLILKNIKKHHFNIFSIKIIFQKHLVLHTKHKKVDLKYFKNYKGNIRKSNTIGIGVSYSLLDWEAK